MTIFKWTLKLFYAVLTGIFCIFWLSFMPVDGHAISSYIPSNAGLIIEVSSGSKFIELLKNDAAFQELWDDSDAKEIFKHRKELEKADEKYNTLPSLIQQLYPFSETSLSVFAGRKMVIVKLASTPINSNSRKPEWLILTQLSGVRGGLIRLGAWVAQLNHRLPKNIRVFDLGGDVLAIGFNGAQPRLQSQDPILLSQFDPVTEQTLTPTPTEEEVPFLSVHIFPEKLESMKAPRKSEPTLFETQMQDDFAQRLPPKVMDAIQKSPSITEMLNFQKPPREILLHFFKQSDGIRVQGLLDGTLPPLPQKLRGLPIIAAVLEENSSSKKSTDENAMVHAEGLLPFDAQAAFLAFVGSSLRTKHTASKLTRKQNKWLRRFEKLDEACVDLDRELWPLVGHALQFNIQQPPEELSTSGYDLIFAETEFASLSDPNETPDSILDPALDPVLDPEEELNLISDLNTQDILTPAEQIADDGRYAATELARVYWDYLFEGRPTKEPPYVRCVRRKHASTFVLANKQLTSPTWRITNGTVLLTSDSGPFAIKNPVTAEEALVARPRGKNLKPEAYFLRLKGTLLSNTVEKIATAIYDAKEEEMGSKEFLEEIPDASIRIRLAGKLSRFLGHFEASVKPAKSAGNPATIRIEWKPERLAAPIEVNAEAKVEDSVAPPPPPSPPAPPAM